MGKSKGRCPDRVPGQSWWGSLVSGLALPGAAAEGGARNKDVPRRRTAARVLVLHVLARNPRPRRPVDAGLDDQRLQGGRACIAGVVRHGRVEVPGHAGPDLEAAGAGARLNPVHLDDELTRVGLGANLDDVIAVGGRETAVDEVGLAISTAGHADADGGRRRRGRGGDTDAAHAVLARGAGEVRGAEGHAAVAVVTDLAHAAVGVLGALGGRGRGGLDAPVVGAAPALGAVHDQPAEAGDGVAGPVVALFADITVGILLALEGQGATTELADLATGAQVVAFVDIAVAVVVAGVAELRGGLAAVEIIIVGEGVTVAVEPVRAEPLRGVALPVAIAIQAGRADPVIAGCLAARYLAHMDVAGREAGGNTGGVVVGGEPIRLLPEVTADPVGVEAGAVGQAGCPAGRVVLVLVGAFAAENVVIDGAVAVVVDAVEGLGHRVARLAAALDSALVVADESSGALTSAHADGAGTADVETFVRAAIAVVVVPVTPLVLRRDGVVVGNAQRVHPPVGGTDHDAGLGAFALPEGAVFPDIEVFVALTITVVVDVVAGLLARGEGLAHTKGRAGEVGGVAHPLTLNHAGTETHVAGLIEVEVFVALAITVVVDAVAEFVGHRLARHGVADDAVELRIADQFTRREAGALAGVAGLPKGGEGLVGLAIAVVVAPVAELRLGRRARGGVADNGALGVTRPDALRGAVTVAEVANAPDGVVTFGAEVLVDGAVAVVVDAVTGLGHRRSGLERQAIRTLALEGEEVGRGAHHAHPVTGADARLTGLAGVLETLINTTVTVVVAAVPELGEPQAGVVVSVVAVDAGGVGALAELLLPPEVEVITAAREGRERKAHKEPEQDAHVHGAISL